MPYRINMFSKAYTVKGQGVASAHDEMVSLVRGGLQDRFTVTENKWAFADITHYHTVNLPYYLSIPFMKRHGMTVGYVHFLPETLRDSLSLPPLSRRVFNQYLLSFYRSMDRLVVVNPYFIDRLEDYGVERDRVCYIPNFVDEHLFYPAEPEKKRALRRKFGLNEDAFTVVCAGQLQTRKGVSDFVQCAQEMPDVQFVWAGGFSFKALSSGYEDMRELVKHAPKNCTFLGIVERDQMNEFYQTGDLMFLPSYEELFPMCLLEAMCCRLPILLRDVPLYKNILDGYYCKADDVDGFKQQIRRLADDADYYREAVDKAWEGHRFYSRSYVLAQWDDFYTDLVSADPVKRRRAETKAHKAKLREKKASNSSK